MFGPEGGQVTGRYEGLHNLWYSTDIIGRAGVCQSVVFWSWGMSVSGVLELGHVSQWCSGAEACQSVVFWSWGMSVSGVPELGHVGQWCSGAGAYQLVVFWGWGVSVSGVLELGHISQWCSGAGACQSVVFWSWGVSVSGVLELAGDRDLFCSPRHRDQLWHPPHPLFSGFQAFFPCG